MKYFFSISSFRKILCSFLTIRTPNPFYYGHPIKNIYYLFIQGPKSPVGEQMKYVIVYWSRYGNGKKLVEHLAGTLSKRGETKLFTTDEADPTAMPMADTYIFSAATEALNVQKNMRNFMKRLKGMDAKKYGVINTHGMDKNRLDKMEKLLSKKNMMKVADIDFKVTGNGTQTGNGLMEGWEAKLDEFAEKL